MHYIKCLFIISSRCNCRSCCFVSSNIFLWYQVSKLSIQYIIRYSLYDQLNVLRSNQISKCSGQHLANIQLRLHKNVSLLNHIGKVLLFAENHLVVYSISIFDLFACLIYTMSCFFLSYLFIDISNIPNTLMYY